MQESHLFTVDTYPATDIVQRPPGWCGNQRGTEFSRFVDRLVEYECHSLLFIGAGNGGNQWAIAHRFRQLGWESTMRVFDIRANLGLLMTFDLLAHQCPECRIRLTLADSQHLKPEDLGQHDAAFVDGDHGYPQTLHDVRICDAVVKHFVGVHDISNLGGRERMLPCGEAWQELKKGRRVEEFLTDWQMGIGILYKEEAKP